MREPVIIVGGGPVGAVLALLLAQKGIATTVLEARKKGAAYSENRALALSFGSRKILEKLGVWTALAPHATAINTIHVSQKGSLGRSILRAQDFNLAALGYVVSYGALSAVLDDAFAKTTAVNFVFEAIAETITYHPNHATVTYQQNQSSQTLNSALVVLADGGRGLDEMAGMIKETKEYGHDALISKVSAELPHHNIAYERFTAYGPMALLPNGARDFSLVWTGKKERVAKLLNLTDEEFLAQLHAEFGDRVGRFLSVEKRLTFPLRLSQLKTTDTPHLVVIGNAAQTMHPVAGQGLNVGMRDAQSLAKCIVNCLPEQLGVEKMLADYRASRQTDTKNGLLFTDFLVNIFSNEIVGISGLRSLGLGVFDLVKPIKAHLVGKMSFGQ